MFRSVAAMAILVVLNSDHIDEFNFKHATTHRFNVFYVICNTEDILYLSLSSDT